MDKHIQSHGKALIGHAIENFVMMKTKDRVGISFLILSALFSLFALGLFLFGTHLWFIENFSTPIAYMYTGATFFGTGLLFTCLAGGYYYYKYSRLKKLKQDIALIAQDLIDLGINETKTLLDEKPAQTIIAASIAGYAAGKRYL